MIIAVNIRVLSGNSAIIQLMVDCFEMMAVNHPEHEFIFIAEKDFAEQSNNLQNVKRILLPQQSDNPLLWKLWYNYKLPSLLKKIKAAIFALAVAYSGSSPDRKVGTFFIDLSLTQIKKCF